MIKLDESELMMAKSKQQKITQSGAMVPARRIERLILLIRGQKVMLDSDLAALYGVQTKHLKRAVNRHRDRFPEDFMFELTKEEYGRLRYQFGTLKRGQHSKYAPYAFTEQGVAMLSTVLNSPRAVHANIAIMRTFVRLRRMLETHKELARKIAELEKKYDEQFRVVFEVIRQLTSKKPPAIGFHAQLDTSEAGPEGKKTVREKRAKYRTKTKKTHGKN